jgi:hypothetical protein
MSIRENDLFNQKFDCIEGYDDFGSQNRKCNIANHALIFMILGLHQKWKHPVAYYLSRGSTNAEILKQFLNRFLEHVRMLYCMMCDMGTNNVKAMKQFGSPGGAIYTISESSNCCSI